MNNSIKAIIFDYGNVLCEPQRAEDMRELAALLDMPEERVGELYWQHRAAYDRAEFDDAGYWTRVAGGRPRPETLSRLVDKDTQSWLTPRPATLPWVDAARRHGLGTALLSNLPVPLRNALENGCPWLPRFDVRTYSCNVKSSKPDAPIYESCIAGLGVRPEEAIFLDDRPENIEGAANLGIHGIRFESAHQAAQELRERFGLAVE